MAIAVLYGVVGYGPYNKALAQAPCYRGLPHAILLRVAHTLSKYLSFPAILANFMKSLILEVKSSSTDIIPKRVGLNRNPNTGTSTPNCWDIPRTVVVLMCPFLASLLFVVRSVELC